MRVAKHQRKTDPKDCTHMVKEVMADYSIRCLWCHTTIRRMEEVQKRVHIVEPTNA